MASCPLCGKPSPGGEPHGYHFPGGQAPGTPKKPKFTSIGTRDEEGNVRCPNCGGAQFKAKRSLGRKVGLGLASLLTTANEVECVTCGKKFKRG